MASGGRAAAGSTRAPATPLEQRLERRGRGARGRRARPRLRERLGDGGGHRGPGPARRAGASSATTSTAARTGCSSGCCATWASTRAGSTSSDDPAATLRGAARRRTPGWSGWSRPAIRCSSSSTSPRWRRAAHAHIGARGEPPIVVVDNTFASPLAQQPLPLGADIVYHSATKYLVGPLGHRQRRPGHLPRRTCSTRLRFLQNAIGAVPGPFDCFLVLRGLRTLELRMAAPLQQRAARGARRWRRGRTSRSCATRASPMGRMRIPRRPWPRRQMRYAGRHDLVPARARGRAASPRNGRSRFCEATTDLLAGGVAGWRGVAARGALRHDPRRGPGLGAGGAPLARPAVGGHRGPGRPGRGRPEALDAA